MLGDEAFAEIVLWRVPVPIRGCAHLYKYRLALVVEGECVLRYDNEAGKGDHRHARGLETAYAFDEPAALIADFESDVRRYLEVDP